MLIKLLKNDKWGSWRHHNWNKTTEYNWKGFLLVKHGWTRAHLLQQLRVISFNGAPRLWLLASTQIPGTCSSAGNTESICCSRNPPITVLDICGNSGSHSIHTTCYEYMAFYHLMQLLCNDVTLLWSLYKPVCQNITLVCVLVPHSHLSTE